MRRSGPRLTAGARRRGSCRSRHAGIALEAPNETLREIAWTISRTEYWHAQLQQALLASEPLASPPPTCAQATGNFAADVETAIQGELGAVTRYSQLARVRRP